MIEMPHPFGRLVRIAESALVLTIPRSVAEAAARRLLDQLARRHPGVISRLEDLGARRVRFEPAELPFAFVLGFAAGTPNLRVVPIAAAGNEATVVRGPLPLLIGLLEGRIDGDAAFFSRQITVHGDTEPIVLLRNALEAAEIDLKSDVAAAFGPLEPAVLRALSATEVLARAGAARIRSLRRYVLGPLEDGLSRQSARLSDLDARIAALETRAARRRADAVSNGMETG